MKIGGYKINSSVILASIVALVGATIDLLTSGWVVDGLAEVVIYFLNQPDRFKPYIADNIYRALITFLPLMSIFLRMHRVHGRPPIEKIEKQE